MNRITFATTVRWLPATLAVTACAGMAQAQNAPSPESSAVLDEVIVTAQRRQEAAKDVPITISTLSADTLSEAAVRELSDIGKLVTGFRFDVTAGYSQPTIRGVGSSIITSGTTSNVGTYVDGFYVPNPLLVDTQMLNVENLQVLKGPQGTLFGRNTTGGAMLITTARPSTETGGFAELSYDSNGSTRAGLYGTTGLTDSVAVDIEGVFDGGDGYWDQNTVTGDADDGDFDNWSGRVGLAVDFSENARMLLRYIHHDVDDARTLSYNTGVIDGQFFQVSAFAGTPAPGMSSDPDTIAVEQPTGFKSEADIFQLTLEFDLGFAHLKSYTQYRDEETQIQNDTDASAATLMHTDFWVKDDTLTQEFLLSSSSEGPLQWTAGVFYLDYEDTYFPVDALIPPFGITNWLTLTGSNSETYTYAGYLDVTYEVIDNLFLTAGVRYSKDKVKDAKYYQLDFATFTYSWVTAPDYEDDRVTPRFVVRYALNDDSSIYASYSQGYKAGFLDVANPPPILEVDPEEIDAYEVGYKYAGDRLGFDVSAWYYDYSDLQISIFPDGATAVTVNSAEATIKGLEGQLRYAVTDKLQVTAGAAWMDTEYDRFPDYFRPTYIPQAFGGPSPYGIFYFAPGYDVSGNEMQRAPEFTATLGVRYETAVAGGTLVLSGNLYNTSEFYFDPSNFVKEDGYTTLGLNAAWTSPTERYTVTVYGTNVTDEEYRLQATISSFALYTLWAPPATVGASLRVNF